MYMYTAAHVGPCYITVAAQCAYTIPKQPSCKYCTMNLCLSTTLLSDSHSTMWVDLFPHSDSLSLCWESGHRHGTTYTHVYAALPYRAAESGHTPQVREGVGMVSRGPALIEGVDKY